MTNIKELFYHDSHDEIPVWTKIAIALVSILAVALIIS